MDGFLIIDKPPGISSHDVVRAIRRLLKTRRVGHIGTLDPMATGVLPIAVGFATRLVEFLAVEDKSYLATMKLGEFTDTQDAEGQVTATLPYDGLDSCHIKTVARSFIGQIEQTPPMFSAVKIRGKPLYKLARQGIEVERKKRFVTIYRLDILDVNLPFITFKVTCSKGTYIRTLCQDMAEALGTAGHLSSLRRTRNGHFSLGDTVPLEELKKMPAGTVPPGLLSMTEGMKNFPSYEIGPETAGRLKHGIPPAVTNLEEQTVCRSGEIITFREGNKLLAVARFAPERETEKRGDFKLLKVFSQS
jgi:tRNA pseudouridine55 synthase